MTHPLTDEMIQSIWDKVGNDQINAYDEAYDEGRVEIIDPWDDLMRTAYDLAIEHVWNVWDELIETSESDYKLAFRFHRKLYDMRPQQQEKNS